MRYDLVQLNSDEVKNEFPDYYDDYEGDMYHALVVRSGDGTIIRLVSVDGGEPEDNLFLRDWSWVPGELNEAYRLGVHDGYREGIEDGRELDG